MDTYNQGAMKINTQDNITEITMNSILSYTNALVKSLRVLMVLMVEKLGVPLGDWGSLNMKSVNWSFSYVKP